MNALRLAFGVARDRLGRLTYLAVIVAVATASWLGLSVLVAAFLPPRLAASGGFVDVSAASGSQPLPLRYAEQIESMDGVAGVAYSSSAVVKCKPGAPAVSIQAFGGSRRALYALGLWPERSASLRTLQDKWQQDPLSVLVGAEIAKACGWHAGLGVAPEDAFTGRPVEIHIAGVLPHQQNAIANFVSFGHYDYISRAAPATGGYGQVSNIEVMAASPSGSQAIAARIEAALAHSNPPVQANTDTVAQSALGSFGNAKEVLGYVMLAELLCAALVLVSVLAHAVAERRAQLAVLKILGFSRSVLWASVALEAIAVVVVGAAVGATVALGLLRLAPRSIAVLFGNFAIPAWAWWGLPVWSAALLAAALVLPSLAIARLKPTDVRAV